MKKVLSILIISIIFSCSKKDSDNYVASDQNLITSFKLNINNNIENGIINQNSGTISFDLIGADLSSLIPMVEYSDKATITPSVNAAQNFNTSLIYTVVAENGDSKMYTVLVDNRPFETESKITSFSVDISGETIEAVIDEQEKTIMFNSGTADISAITPTIIISDYATISPTVSVAQDFNNIVEYTVTAENGDASVYTVSANKPSINFVGPSFSGNQIYFAGVELFVVGHFLNPNAPSAEFLISDGVNEYILTESSSIVNELPDNVLEYRVSFNSTPFDIPTASDYKLIYRTNAYSVEFEEDLDIQTDGPNNFMLNQSSYSYNDIFIVNGTNLVPGLVVPSNGNQFIVENSNNYDIAVNSDGTQLTWTLDYYQHFPAYYGNEPEEKKIYTLGENRRVGKSIVTIFN